MLWKCIISLWLFPLSQHRSLLWSTLHTLFMHFQRHFVWWVRWGWNFYMNLMRAKPVVSTYFESPRWALIFPVSALYVFWSGFRLASPSHMSHKFHYALWHFQIVSFTTFPNFIGVTRPRSYRKTEIQILGDYAAAWIFSSPHSLHIFWKQMNWSVRDNFIPWGSCFMHWGHWRKQGSCGRSTKWSSN